MKNNNSNWFESPHPTSFCFANNLQNKDYQQEEDHQLRNSNTPFPLTHHPLSPFIHYQQESRLSIPQNLKENNQDSQGRPIMERLIFSSEDQEEELQTPFCDVKIDEEINTTGRKSHNGKMNAQKRSRPKEKGLRGLSAKAYNVVKVMKSTSYNEVAVKLLKELSISKEVKTSTEETNVKRRVYDALNVMIAVGVLQKEGRKIIVQAGVEHNSRKMKDEIEILSKRLTSKEEVVNEKRLKLNEAQQKLRGIRGLLKRNRENKETVKSSGHFVHFPFVGVTHFSSWTCEEMTPQCVQIRFNMMVRPFGDMDSLNYL